MGEQAGRYVDMGELQRMLDALESPAMREALEEQDPEFALEILQRYFAAGELARADMRAFFDSDGPRMVHEAKLKHHDGVPTSADLKTWATR